MEISKRNKSLFKMASKWKYTDEVKSVEDGIKMEIHSEVRQFMVASKWRYRTQAKAESVHGGIKMG